MQVRAAQPDGDEGGGDPGDLGHRPPRHLHGIPRLPRAGAQQGSTVPVRGSYVTKVAI